MHAVMFFFLFRDFYLSAYKKRPKQKPINGHSSPANGHAEKNGYVANGIMSDGEPLSQKIKAQ